MSASTTSPPFAPPEPTWDIARLFPDQGAWSEEEYLALNGNRLVEFSNGYLEVLPMPTTSHQSLVFLLCRILHAFAVAHQAGRVLPAPLRVRLWEGKFREPDVRFMRTEHQQRMGESYWDGADLVMEVVSDDDRRRDLETKRREYAQAGIPEYWIIDPRERTITVLTLDAGRGRYVEHCGSNSEATATSVLLPGFAVVVAAVFSS